MDNMASNVTLRSTKQRKDNLITRKQDKSPEKTIRGTRGAYRGIPSTSKRPTDEDNDTGSTERLDRPKKFISQNKSNYGLGKRPDFSLKNRNVHLASSRYGQVSRLLTFNITLSQTVINKYPTKVEITFQSIPNLAT